MQNKILTLLGFAAKAGKIGFGFDAAVAYAKGKKAKLIAVSEEISPKSKKEIQFYCDKYNVKYIVLKNFDNIAIEKAVGRKCGIVSINETGFADAIESATKENDVGGNADDR